MKKESAQSIGKIKALMEERNQYKRYLRIREVTREYGIGIQKATEIAKECGAYRLINKLALIEMNAFEAYYSKRYKKEKN